MSNLIFITYTLMCFFSLQAITLAVFIIKHNDSGNTKALKAMRNFILVSVVLGLFYYITYYRELVLGLFAANFLLRALDSIIFYVMGHSWIKLVDALIDSQSPKMKLWRKYTNPIFLVLMALSAAVYVFLLDEFYSTDSMLGELIVIATEVVLGLTVIVFTVAYVFIGYREITDKTSKKYIIFVSVLVNFNNLWNNTVVIFVFIRALDLSVRCSLLYGITSILLLIINLYTVFHMYKKDFSPIFSRPDISNQEVLTEEERLDLVSHNHRLTEREREILILAYQGMSNPEIAAQLFISPHTVKRHMHNIFAKLNVSTRMEMIHIIQSETAS